MSPLHVISLGCGLLLLPFLVATPTDTSPEPPKANRYIGAKACKNCHKGAEKGAAHEMWEKGPHAGAYKTLATEDAKAAAKAAGVEDAQKDAKCLKCHTTAHGVDKKEIKRGFKATDGVQCESCHGPGENHFKIRFKESMAKGDPSPVGADEIIASPDAKTCTKCHNKESPTFTDFCFKERMKEIRHLDPRKERSDEEVKKIEATCTPDCPKCAKEKDG